MAKTKGAGATKIKGEEDVRLLQNLGPGDVFRIARAQQASLNRLPLSREDVLVVTKVYAQSPYTVICKKQGSPTQYSLPPGTPVLFPSEPDPEDEDILQFLSPVSRKKVVGYKVLWDGTEQLEPLLSPQAAACLRLAYAVGRKELPSRELNDLMLKHLPKFLLKKSKADSRVVFMAVRRLLVDRGFLGEIVDEVLVQADRDAGMGEVA